MLSGQHIRVLVATQAEEVYEILEERDDVRYDIALYTGTIQELLPDVQLIIIDYDDIVEYPLSEAELREQIFAANVYECRSEDFVANPDSFLEGLIVSSPGKMLALPEHYTIAFVSYSGGAGRTTLALDTAFYYAGATKKARQKRRGVRDNGSSSPDGSAMVVELCYGVSSLLSITGLDMACLMALATDPESTMQAYRGVSMVPMDYENVRMLAVDLLERYFQRQVDLHSLTVVDSIWPHGLSNALAPKIDLWIVVATERPDTIVNAQKLYEELVAEYREDKVWLLQNQVSDRGLETGSDLSWDLQLPHVARPDEYRGELGRTILSRVFAPLWEENYGKQRKSGLFG